MKETYMKKYIIKHCWNSMVFNDSLV